MEPETSPPPPRGGTMTAPTSESQQSQADLFEQITAYSFTSDPEFATGLAIILGHPETPASEEEITRSDDLVLQAKCYYYSSPAPDKKAVLYTVMVFIDQISPATRKEKLTPPLDVAGYKAWLEARPTHSTSFVGSREYGSIATSSSLCGNRDQELSTSPPEPTYPTSFAHIVELITTGQPVPGIQEIPDTLLTGQGAESAKPRRLKPWERQETAQTS
ncbi:DUF5572 domain-containing protein [Aspergillus undulatus]|uniref:DUF5572 domain-containing protein n=1 Tax=Aspergillus undulatus TaxID=1810928 RepID=UPI003CCD0245